MCQVSIHSLTQRETHCGTLPRRNLGVSIHSLTQRETGQPASATCAHFRFQSTPSRRGRRRVGAMPPTTWLSFNPLPHAEGDGFDTAAVNTLNSFQSTPSRRGRRRIRPMCARLLWFQSTPSRRGRPKCFTESVSVYMFQSTPSRRGRHGPA